MYESIRKEVGTLPLKDRRGSTVAVSSVPWLEEEHFDPQTCWIPVVEQSHQRDGCIYLLQANAVKHLRHILDSL